MKIDINVSEYVKTALLNYLKYGYEPGGFVTAMLAMDMRGAIVRADTWNAPKIWEIGQWIMAVCPEQAWGSYQAVRAWCEDQDERRTKWAMWDTLMTPAENCD